MAVREKANAANLSKLAKCSSVTGTSLLLLFLAVAGFCSSLSWSKTAPACTEMKGKTKGVLWNQQLLGTFPIMLLFYLIGYVLFT